MVLGIFCCFHFLKPGFPDVCSLLSAQTQKREGWETNSLFTLSPFSFVIFVNRFYCVCDTCVCVLYTGVKNLLMLQTPFIWTESTTMVSPGGTAMGRGVRGNAPFFNYNTYDWFLIASAASSIGAAPSALWD